MNRQNRLGQAAAVGEVIGAAVLWGLLGVFARRLTAAGLGSMETGAVRMGVGFLGVGLYLLIFHRDRFRIRLTDLWIFFADGVVSLLFFMWCYLHAIEMTSLAVAGILLYTSPVFVMLLSALLFRERLTGRKILALALAFGGCALVSGLLGGAERPSGTAILYGLGAGLGYGLYSIFGRFAVRQGYDAWTTTFYSFAFCLAGCLVMADVPLIVRCAAAEPDLLVWYLALGLLTGLAAYQLYNRALQTLESSRAAVIASLEPVVAAAAGAVIYHERIGIPGLCGMALVLTAIALLSLSRKT